MRQVEKFFSKFSVELLNLNLKQIVVYSLAYKCYTFILHIVDNKTTYQLWTASLFPLNYSILLED